MGVDSPAALVRSIGDGVTQLVRGLPGRHEPPPPV
jgi:hypothetical protein